MGQDFLDIQYGCTAQTENVQLKKWSRTSESPCKIIIIQNIKDIMILRHNIRICIKSRIWNTDPVHEPDQNPAYQNDNLKKNSSPFIYTRLKQNFGTIYMFLFKRASVILINHLVNETLQDILVHKPDFCCPVCPRRTAVRHTSAPLSLKILQDIIKLI